MDSTRVGDPGTGTFDPDHFMLGIIWKGHPHYTYVVVPCTPVPYDPDRYQDRGMERDEVCDLVERMRSAFEREGTYRVEFVRGQLNMFGSAGVQASTGGRRSTDPRFHESRYIVPRRDE